MERRRIHSLVFSIVFKGLFTAIGFGLMIGALAVMLSGRNFIRNSFPVSGEIIDIAWDGLSETYETIAGYEVAGESYIRDIGFYSSDMRPGDVIEILVSNVDPWDIRYPGSDTLAIIVLFSMGTVFLFFGVMCIIIDHRKRKKTEDLLATGIRVEAKIIDIRENTNESLDGYHPLIIYCRYDSPDGRIYLFHSDSVWKESYQINPDALVPVYVDKNNPSHYYVDTNEI